MRVISGKSGRFTVASSGRRVGARVHLVCVATIALLASTACASSSASTSAGPKAGPNLITADEVARANVQNAYEAVQKLRPAMLRPRQMASANGQGGVMKDAPTGSSVAAGEVMVYMDNTRLGDITQLRGISASSIASVRYFSASEAQTKWGSGHAGGVIEVVTKR
jgi:hypothetical protein